MSNAASSPPGPSPADRPGAGDDGERLIAGTRGGAGSARRRRGVGGWRRLALLAAAIAVLAGVLGTGWRSGIARDAGEATPGAGSADVGFLRDMIVHHEQAVTMAFLMRDRSTDNLMDAIATDIIYTQLIQIGMMRGYLTVWNVPTTGTEPAMAWMGHPVPDGTAMPGMASAEEMVRLRTLPLPEAEILFLRLMIRHHAAGVEMAQAGMARVSTRPARDLAETIVPVQFNEIQLMQQELSVRGEDPEPLPDATGMGRMAGMPGMDAEGGAHEMHDMGTPSGTPASGS